jgi:hypothetical protein
MCVRNASDSREAGEHTLLLFDRDRSRSRIILIILVDYVPRFPIRHRFRCPPFNYPQIYMGPLNAIGAP